MPPTPRAVGSGSRDLARPVNQPTSRPSSRRYSCLVIDENKATAVDKILFGAISACLIGLGAGAVIQFGNLPVAIGSVGMPQYLALVAGVAAAVAGGLMSNRTVSRPSAVVAVVQMATLTYLLGVALMCVVALGDLNRQGLTPFGVLLPLAFVLYAPLLAMMLIPAAAWVTVMRVGFPEARPAGDDWDPREDLAIAAEQEKDSTSAGR